MARPFVLHKHPPITLEIKYGKKTAKAAKKLNHFLVVSREREKDSFNVDNYSVLTEVHKKLGEDESLDSIKDANGESFPTEIPIRFFTDDPKENFFLFRGFFKKSTGVLGCGSAYGEDMALRRFFWKDDFPEGTKPEDVELPYETKCGASCPFWKMDKDGCDLSGTLYFRLPDEYPRSNQLGAVRVKGTWAQRTLESSIELIHKMTGGILANLPLKLRIHFETKRSKDGKYYSIPMLTVEPGLPPMEFSFAVEQEVERRKSVYRTMNWKDPESINDLLVKGVLSSINSREAVIYTMDGEFPGDGDDIEIEEVAAESLDLPEEIMSKLKEFPDKWQHMMIDKYTKNGELDLEEFDKFLDKELERKIGDIF